MRISVISDLHLDHDIEPFVPARVECDVVVIAGDIDIGRKGLSWIRENYRDVPVVYVLGNHEFYFHAFPELVHDLRKETECEGIHVLENDSVNIQGVEFLGCTLWTDFKLHGLHQRTTSMRVAEREMRDFDGCIRHKGFDGDDGHEYRFMAFDAFQTHENSLKWLRQELRSRVKDPVVVVTHHAPCTRSTHPERKWSPLAPAFASDLDRFVEASGARAWVHGHVHRRADYLQGATRVVANPRGYPSSESGFDRRFTIDIDLG